MCVCFVCVHACTLIHVSTFSRRLQRALCIFLFTCCTVFVSHYLALFSGSDLNVGAYGTILAGFECTHGQYTLTLSLLDLISAIVQVSFMQILSHIWKCQLEIVLFVVLCISIFILEFMLLQTYCLGNVSSARFVIILNIISQMNQYRQCHDMWHHQMFMLIILECTCLIIEIILIYRVFSEQFKKNSVLFNSLLH